MTTVVTINRQQGKEAASKNDDINADIRSMNSALGLGQPRATTMFFWHKKVYTDPKAIATQSSVFDDPQTTELYKPQDNWENSHRFDPSARWTWEEEDKVVRKIDWRIMAWTTVIFIGLEIDRANIQQAMTDNFLGDLGMDTNDFNMGGLAFSLSFLLAELPSQLISKWVGPDRWIPLQLVLWSAVATAQFGLSGRASFLTCRALLGLLQGGFVPDIVLYLSYFYKHEEMAFRLGFFWMAMTFADIIAAFLGAGILHMRGVLGYAGWRWMFLIEGLLTLTIGLFSFLLMPAGPTQTASWFRGRNGWFTPREEKIMVNRIIRDDPSKGDMNNRERLTLRALWKSLCDYDLWPIYLIGVTYMVPTIPPASYLTLSLRQLGFNILQSNLLVIPSQVLKSITMMALIWVAEGSGQLLAWASFAQVWGLPFLIWLRVSNINEQSPWLVWAMLTLLISKPLSHPIHVSIVSRNSNTTRSRTVSAALYNMASQFAGIIGSNIYREDDRPLYRTGNTVLIAISAYNLCLYFGAKIYYSRRNKKRDATWDAMTQGDRLAYLEHTADEGSKRLDFRFRS